jgi:hypothetical protein
MKNRVAENLRMLAEIGYLSEDEWKEEALQAAKEIERLEGTLWSRENDIERLKYMLKVMITERDYMESKSRYGKC